MYHVGYLRETALLQHLGDVDKVNAEPRTHAFVEVADCLDLHLLVPLQTLLKEPVQFLLRNLVLKFCRRVPFGDTEQDAIIIVLNLEQFYITCARHKTVVIAVDVTVELIVACIKMVVCLEQTHLIHAPDTGKHLYRFGRVALDALERDVASNDIEHPLAHCSKLIVGKRTVHTAIVTFGNCILEANSLPGEHLIHRLHEDKKQRTHIHAHAVI